MEKPHLLVSNHNNRNLSLISCSSLKQDSVPYLAEITMQRTFHFLVCEIVLFMIIMPLMSGMHSLLQPDSTSVPRCGLEPQVLCCVHNVCAVPVLAISPVGTYSRQCWEHLERLTSCCLTCGLICQLELPRVHEDTQTSHSSLKTRSISFL